VKRVLLDENVPHALRGWVTGCTVETVAYRGWSGLRNGELLARAAKDYDVLITADQNLPSQQNLSIFAIGIVVLPSTRPLILRPLARSINLAIQHTAPHRVTVVAQSP